MRASLCYMGQHTGIEFSADLTERVHLLNTWLLISLSSPFVGLATDQ